MTKIIISGGGTGGHIFPAIAIANALKKMEPDVDILFVGAQDKMEMEKVPKAGYPIKGLWISGFQRKLTWQNVAFPFKLMSSLWKSVRIVRQFKPDVVVGVGGYASGPLVYAATLFGVPALIQEQNSFPGITNRLLAKRVNKICVVYENTDRFFPKEKMMVTGNPVRDLILNLNATRSEALSHFGLAANKKVLFITGGSLGAKGINEGIAAHLDKFVAQDIQLIWQAGKFYLDWAKELVKGKEDLIKVSAFIDRMDLAYIASDAIISRAGGIISELSIVGKPVILMPSPNVTEDHQTANGRSLVEQNAAIMIKDSEAEEKLWKATEAVLFNETKRRELSTNIKKRAITNAAERIAKEVLQLKK